MAKAQKVPGVGRVKPKHGYEFKSDGSIGLKDGWEIFEGVPQKVADGSRSGWWRFHEHYDRDGYCDNPGRGY